MKNQSDFKYHHTDLRMNMQTANLLEVHEIIKKVIVGL